MHSNVAHLWHSLHNVIQHILAFMVFKVSAYCFQLLVMSNDGVYVSDSTRLSSQSRIINLETYGLYHDVLQFCIAMWPNAGIFSPGMVEQHYLAPVGMVRNHSYVEFDGIRYGAHEHTSGKGYCYGYIDGRYPVRIERVLHIKIPGEAELQCICIMVRPFQAPQVESEFPWDAW
jgi:hypothetical protein